MQMMEAAAGGLLAASSGDGPTCDTSSGLVGLIGGRGVEG
jgi:hypothetical protein